MSEPIRVAVDVVVAGVDEAGLHVLLVRRGVEPFKGRWALPGVALGVDEPLETAARRAVEQRAGITDLPVIQVGAFGAVKRDPRNRVVAICHTMLVDRRALSPKPGKDTEKVEWHSVSDLPTLAFDHKKQCEAALDLVRREVAEFRLGFELLPNTFTLLELQHLHESVLGEPLDKPNFRRRVLDRGVLAEVRGQVKSEGRGRPAQLYRPARTT